MREFDIIGLVRYFLDQGSSVCYMDADKERRDSMHRQLTYLNSCWNAKLIIASPELSGKGMEHVNVLITVNDRDWDAVLLKEARFIPGVCNGRMPAHIRLSI